MSDLQPCIECQSLTPLLLQIIPDGHATVPACLNCQVWHRADEILPEEFPRPRALSQVRTPRKMTLEKALKLDDLLKGGSSIPVATGVIGVSLIVGYRFKNRQDTLSVALDALRADINQKSAVLSSR